MNLGHGLLLSTCTAWALSACSGWGPDALATEKAPARPGCGGPRVPIGHVQGRGASSPFAGQMVEVEGVVTARLPPSTEGVKFYIESETPDESADSAEALLVVLAPERAAPDPGERLKVRARVVERRGVTALESVELMQSCGRTAPAPRRLQFAELRADADASRLERWENMWVLSEEAWTLIDASRLWAIPEVIATIGHRPYADGHDLASPNPGAAPRLWRVRDAGLYELPWTWPGAGPSDVRAGARAARLEGIVQLETETPVVWTTRSVEWQSPTVMQPAPPAPGALRVAALNVHNYFVQLGRLGAQTDLELDRQRGELVTTLLGLDADVIGLVELENRDLASLSDLARSLNERLHDERRYAFSSTLPPVGSAISVGLLYRPSRMRPLSEAWFDSSPTFRRAPLFQGFEVAGQPLTVGVVHLKSKRCDDAAGMAGEATSNEGCGAEVRQAEVRELSARIDVLAEPFSAERLLLLGDFNANPKETPIQMLLQNGLIDLLAGLDPADRYSYLYQGRANLFDYAFGSRRIANALSHAAIWHINADRPASPRAEDAPMNAQGGANAVMRSSDHDPILVDLLLDDLMRE